MLRTAGWVVSVVLLAGCPQVSTDPVDDGDGATSQADGAGTASTAGADSGTGGQSDTGGSGAATSTLGTDSDAQCEDDVWDDGSDQDDGGEESGFGMGDDMPLSVYAVQAGEAAPGQRVLISSVIVTTPPASSEGLFGSEFFVQEAAGGEFSGLRINTFFDAGLVPGDQVDIAGEVLRYQGYYVLMVGADQDIDLLGTAALPPAEVVDASILLPSNSDARAYEGVVVRVENATVTEVEPCSGEFELEDTVRVDDRFMPDAVAQPEPGHVFVAVEGVLAYATDRYELAPPDPSGIQ